MTTKRPRRTKKDDRLLARCTRQDELRCDMAVAPFDRVAREMDEKWGTDRLPELVSVETAGRYGSILAKLNAAIAAHDAERVEKVAQGCIRGMRAMDAEAEAAGAQPARRDVWEFERNGQNYGIMKDGCNWRAIKKDRPDLILYSMSEVAIALERLAMGAVGEVKKNVPGAEIVSAGKRVPELPDSFWENGGDQLEL